MRDDVKIYIHNAVEYEGKGIADVLAELKLAGWTENDAQSAINEVLNITENHSAKEIVLYNPKGYSLIGFFFTPIPLFLISLANANKMRLVDAGLFKKILLFIVLYFVLIIGMVISFLFVFVTHGYSSTFSMQLISGAVFIVYLYSYIKFIGQREKNNLAILKNNNWVTIKSKTALITVGIILNIVFTTLLGVALALNVNDSVVYASNINIEASARDQIRISQLHGLEIVLAEYKKSQGRYPAGELVPIGTMGHLMLCENGWSDDCETSQNYGYLPKPPTMAGGRLNKNQPYIYSALLNGASYAIKFSLEQGISDNLFGELKAGEYYLMPLGFENNSIDISTRAIIKADKMGYSALELHSFRKYYIGQQLALVLAEYYNRVGQYPSGRQVFLGEGKGKYLCLTGWAEQCEPNEVIIGPFMSSVIKSDNVCKPNGDKMSYSLIADETDFVIEYCLSTEIITEQGEKLRSGEQKIYSK